MRKHLLTKGYLRLAALFFCSILIVISILPACAISEEGEKKVVRVGFYDSVFMYINGSGKMTGYAYDYLQNIAVYTGWEYEYVSGSWPELMVKLEAGEIDILPDVSYLPERRGKMLFTGQPMGVEHYYLYVREDEYTHVEDVGKAFVGKRVGIMTGSYEKTLFRSWMARNGTNSEIVELDENTDLAEALESGTVDAVVASDAFQTYARCIPVEDIGHTDVYFAVANGRNDLLVELNSAMNEILNVKPSFHNDLYPRYQHTDQNCYLTAAEIEWLEQHGPIRIGYRDNYMAFCGTDAQGNLTGALAEMLIDGTSGIRNASIEFEAIAYPTTQAALDALQAGEIDCVFPVSLGYADAEAQGLFVSGELISVGTYIVTREEQFVGDENTIVAVNAGNPNYYAFLATNYPQWQTKEFENTTECMKAIARGEADCIFLTSYRVSNISETIRECGLTTVYMDKPMTMSISVRREDRVLLSVLNKTISQISDSATLSALSQYSYVERKVTLGEILVENLKPVLIGTSLIFAILVTLTIVSIVTNRRAKRTQKELSESNTKLISANREQKQQMMKIQRLNELFLETQDHAIRDLLGMLVRRDENRDLIVELVHIVAKYFDAKRVSVFEIGTDGDHIFNTYECCAHCVRSKRAELQSIPTKFIGDWLETMSNGNSISFDYAQLHEPDAMRSTEAFKLERVERMVGVPMSIYGVLNGFILVEDPQQHLDHELFLAVAASSINHEIRVVLEKEQEAKYQRELETSREAAEAASRAKTVFLSNMSHDIRTPMNAIMGFATLMERELNEPEKLQGYLRKILDSGDYLLTLINNVLDMARIESGETQLDEQLYDIETEHRKVLSVFESAMRDKRQTLSAGDHIRHRYILCDGLKMRQIWLNLVSNSVKYTPEGGHIGLHTEEIESDKAGYATYVTTVSDDGIGMSPEFLEHIFDSFSRERTTTESKVIGTGLGMSIVKKLVELMDGTIDVSSEPGKGTTFTVTISYRIAEDPNAQTAREEDADGESDVLHGRRVLLTEDNDLNAEIATAILEDMGLLVERAADGLICLDMLRKSAPGYYDIILMDIQMPNMNGYDTTVAIRSSGNTIPIVAMTANAFDEDKKRAKAAGMDDHLAKPIEIPKLVETLKRILG